MPDRLTWFLFHASTILTGVAIGFPFTSTALADEQTAALTIADPQLWIVASDDAEEVTISAEDAMAYCNERGQEMYGCKIKTDEYAEWERGR